MSTTARGTNSHRRPVRFLVLGLFTIVLSLIVLVFAVPLVSNLSSLFAFDISDLTSGIGLNEVLLNSVLVLYDGGVLTVGTGSGLMAIGAAFILVSRPP